ncbi:MAG: hypothetical protein RL291_1891, partial [Pseudomonadota bacterium]
MTTPKSPNPNATAAPAGHASPRGDLDDLRSLIKDMSQHIGTRLNDLEGRVQPPAAEQMIAPPTALQKAAPSRGIPTYATAQAKAPVEPVVDGWDAQTAEALTQIYEGRPVTAQTKSSPPQANQPHVFYVEGSADDATVHAAPIATAVRSEAAVYPKAQGTAPVAFAGSDPSAQSFDNLLHRLSEDRAWLDSRLQEIAARVEANVDHGPHAEGMETLNARLASLEEQLSPLFGSIVTRADLANMADMDAVSAIERQLDGLATAVAETRRDLARLDAIEGALNDLANYAAEARAMDETPHDAQAHGFADMQGQS